MKLETDPEHAKLTANESSDLRAAYGKMQRILSKNGRTSKNTRFVLDMLWKLVLTDYEEVDR